MQQAARGLLALGLLVTMGIASAQDDKEGGLVDNPKFQFWSKFKVNATSVYLETTKYHGPEKDNYPDGTDTRTVVYKLLNVTKDKAIVQTTVLEDEGLNLVESAPTKLHYPAKVKKATLETVLQEFGAKPSDPDKVKVGKEEIECKVLAGTYKKGGVTVEYRFMYSDKVPGGVVKRTRTTKDGDKLVAETTITLRSYGTPMPKKEKEKGKEGQ